MSQTVKNEYCGYEYDKMYESKHGMSPRGDWYYLALVRDGKIIAFGDEQGNYAGGVYCANDCQYQRFVKEKEHIQREYPDLYEKIKDIPLAEENEYPMYRPKKVTPIQGTTSCKYFSRRLSVVEGINLIIDFTSSVCDLHEFCGVLHTNRYDIPDGYNPRLGYKYQILLFYNDELVAIGEKHPKEGEKIQFRKDDIGWDMLASLCLSVHKNSITETNKIY